MSLQLHLLFLLCVALATFAQCLTGFAFGLILIGLVAILELIPLGEVAVVISILTLGNALVTVAGPKPQLDRSILAPLLISSLLGVCLGIWSLGALDGRQIAWLRLLLGGVIILASLMLVVQSEPRAQVSSSSAFWLAGGLCGLLNGLFSSGGPPIVYHLYRQPLGYELIRNTLITVFACNAAMRLGLVAVQGQLTLDILWLSAEALPLVMLLSWLVRRYPPKLSLRTVRWLVFVLLLLAGTSLIAEAVPQLLALYRG
ncbi:TSUP family transporter [Pseudomonas sp. LPB0260]|uniref:TSUP family transporter n=1 Tax=Pseudomonas sp. LPB0260 TaxID=2614442 RepID=UPI0015C2571E|nr:TSUP family transporter [Pseudomonas sp. LPB0260]QLC73668.1 TSUP family transporter [Pseudomonas sp. LPB0260]QLC76442.1 TSUP family transporter [Pseudomonas sp. LPB0260]